MIADFTEPLVDGSNLVVYDACGQQVDNGDSLVASDRITVTMSGEYAGVYTVNFDVVSAVDSHPTNGSFTFSSGGQPCPGEEPAAEEPQESSGGGGGGSNASGGENDASSNSASSATGSKATSPSSKDGDAAGRSRTRDGAQKAKAVSGKGRGRNGSSDRDPAAVTELNSASASDDIEETVPNVWEGIPMGAFLGGLAVSTLIGAAGGKIYAGIMGWRA